jgi:ketosteroid isomerase-like protein
VLPFLEHFLNETFGRIFIFIGIIALARDRSIRQDGLDEMIHRIRKRGRQMSNAPATPISDTEGKDKETLVSIVKEMTESMTGAQSTRHWAEDALWFDIPPFASRGIQPALKFFDKVFGSFQSCKIDILETEVVVNGNMGFVCTIQRVNVVLKTGDAKRLMVRETDCFEKRNGEWKLIHQHASIPSGGDWDGKVTTA